MRNRTILLAKQDISNHKIGKFKPQTSGRIPQLWSHSYSGRKMKTVFGPKKEILESFFSRFQVLWLLNDFNKAI